MTPGDIRQELSLSVTGERVGYQYVYLDIRDIWDQISGHFGHILGLFGPNIGLFGSKIGLGFGLFGPKNGIFGHFLGLFGLNIGYYGKNGQMGLLLSSATEYAFSRYVCEYSGTLGCCKPLDQASVTYFFQLYLYMGNI